MWIKIVRKAGAEPPTVENFGEVLWEGGYRGEEADTPDQFPASILSNFAPQLEVGTWYPVDQFRKFFASFNQTKTIWTEVSVPVLNPQGKSLAAIKVAEDWAARTLVKAVLDLLEGLGQTEDLWIHVE